MTGDDQGVLPHALAYIARGWPVLPLVPGEKRPAIAGGFRSASTEAEFVEREFAHPGRGVGIRTGIAAGLFVFDVDPRNGGAGSFAALIDRHGPLPETLTVRTGGGGFHYYFRMPEHRAAIRCRAKVGGHPGLDIKGEGGYVVAPPSGHPDGGVYEWSTLEGVKAPIAEAPVWLLDLTTDSTSRSAERDRSLDLEGPEGTRNPTIFNLARKLRDAGMSEAATAGMAIQANAGFSPPLPSDEVMRTVASVYTRPPFETLLITDMGNARRFVRLAGDNFRYQPLSRTWFQWNGKWWQTDDVGARVGIARMVAMELLDEASSIEDPDIRKNVTMAAKRIQGVSRLNAIVELGRTEPEIPVMPDKLDTHPHLLNVQNGLVDLRTGELNPHEPTYLITKILPFDYDPSAKCPRFLQFLAETFRGERELITYLQRVFGYVLTGDATEQVFFILNGGGANGKSTLLNITSYVMGMYAGHTPSETLIAHRMGRSSSNDLARLNGLRLVTASEFNPGEKLASGLVKQLTGNEKITARFLYQEHQEFVPGFKLMLATNDIPQMDAADDALFRRVIIIPFERVFTKEEQDRSLADKLKAEAEGILAWMVRGAIDWYAGGLATPHRIASIVDGIRRDMDPVAQFLDEACILGSSHETTAAALHAAYMTWAYRHGLAHCDSRNFGKIIAKKGLRSRKSTGRMVVQGLHLRPEFQTAIHLPGDAA